MGRMGLMGRPGCFGEDPGPRSPGPGRPLAPRRALRTRKCSSDRRSRVQNARLDEEGARAGGHVSAGRATAPRNSPGNEPGRPRPDSTNQGEPVDDDPPAGLPGSGRANQGGSGPEPTSGRGRPARTGPGLRNASSARRSPPRLAPCEPSATESACARFSRARLAQCDPR